MGAIKGLAKDTVIYGLSSIVGRFLNWCLVPLYTTLFPQAEYGVVTYVYSVVAIAMIVLTYGMETGFFRFANHERYGDDPIQVYDTTMVSLTVSTSLFFVAVLCFLRPITDWMQCGDHTSYIWMMAAAAALDTLTAIPFCYLRFRKRPMRFAVLKLIGIAVNIGLNLFFLLLCPWLMKYIPGIIGHIYYPEFGIGYIFLSNLISSSITMLLLIPEYRVFKWRFDSILWRTMLRYSFPLLILGIAGMMNQTIDKILLPHLLNDPSIAMAQLGIYGANYKIAIVMVMFTQAFRFAFEPFIFSQNRQKGVGQLHNYADAMKYFVIFSMVIFLGVMFYLNILKHFIDARYFSGLKIVPIVMIAEFFFGVSFNLSLWYKLTDRTVWGTWFTLLALAVTLAMNFWLVPRIGYMGCAWAALGSYGTMMLVSWAVGSVKYPIPYQTGRLALYFASAIGLWLLSTLIDTGHQWSDMAIKTLLLAIYIVVVCHIEHINPKALLQHGRGASSVPSSSGQ